jgi:hypothetical protein
VAGISSKFVTWHRKPCHSQAETAHMASLYFILRISKKRVLVTNINLARYRQAEVALVESVDRGSKWNIEYTTRKYVLIPDAPIGPFRGAPGASREHVGEHRLMDVVKCSHCKARR